MERLRKIAVIESEVQAERLHADLEARGIPHVMRSYHDSVLDGLFQASRGWGHIEAADTHEAEILEALEAIRRESQADPPPEAPPVE